MSLLADSASMESYRISRWSELEQAIYTEVYRDGNLVGKDRAVMHGSVAFIANPNGHGRMVKYAEGLETFYIPLDCEYGFEDFVTYSYAEDSYELYVSIQDAYENILRERLESLLDNLPTIQRFANGIRQLALYVKRADHQKKLVHIQLDTVMKQTQAERVL